jgi:hypothetical protein
VIVSAINVIVMPLIIFANLRGGARGSPLHAYLWRENPTLMRVILAFLALVMVFSVLTVLAHKGVISQQMDDSLSTVVGVLFMFLSVMVIALIGVTAVRLVRDWRARRLRF